ncbi:mRNA turnover 4 [Borealophlyctis nickersoniae]|nr:mRNA turnover 4 [Borealophlyctis nickersoniae]
MPKSKRAKIVNLTKTDKKGREGKDELFKQVREAVDTYSHVYIFSVENMRNTFLKDVRNEWKDSRFFLGRNRVMAKALGTTAEEEYRDGLAELAQRLIGDVGLLFTNSTYPIVSDYFKSFLKADYARSGVVATQTVTVPAGPVKRGGGELDGTVPAGTDPFPHNMEPQLRALGMPTALVNGVVTLRTDFTICKEGEALTPEQAQLLKHFYIQMAEFHVKFVCYWTDGKFHEVDA